MQYAATLANASLTRHVACEVSSDPVPQHTWPIAVSTRIAYGRGDAAPLISPNYGTDFNQVAVAITIVPPATAVPPSAILVCRGSILYNGMDVSLHSPTFADVITYQVSNFNTQGPPTVITAIDRVKVATLLGAATSGGAAGGAQGFATKKVSTPDGVCSVTVPATWSTSAQGRTVTANTGNANVLFTLGREDGDFSSLYSGIKYDTPTQKTIVKGIEYNGFIVAAWRLPQHGNATPPLDVLTGVAGKRDPAGKTQSACVARYTVYHWSKIQSSVYPVESALWVNTAFH